MISEFEHKRIHKIFAAYCEHKQKSFAVSARLQFQVQPSAVVLYWNYPHPLLKHQAIRKNIAQFRKDEGNTWILYCADSAGCWQLYRPTCRSLDIEQLLKIVDDNASTVFFYPDKIN